MPERLIVFRVKALTVLAAAAFCLLIPAQPAQADDRISGYLWSATAGWISLNCSNLAICATSDYGVRFGKLQTCNDPLFGGQPRTRSRIGGFAWSANMGWICFGRSCDDILDESGSVLTNPEGTDVNYAEWRQLEPFSPKGHLFGWARILNEEKAGWMSLNCNNFKVQRCNPVTQTGTYFFVSRDASSTAFCDNGECSDPAPVSCTVDGDCAGTCEGTTVKRCNPQRNLCSTDADCGGTCQSGFCNPAPLAYPSHWSWNGATEGRGIGWVDWSLATSDWVPPMITRVYRPQGIYEPDNSPIAGEHPSTFEVTAEGVYASKDYLLRCDITKANGAIASLGKVFATTQFKATHTFVYTIPQPDAVRGPVTANDPIQQNRLWYLEGCLLAQEPEQGSSCTTDSECLDGQVCDDGFPGGLGECRVVVVRTGRKPVYAHHNDWTLFDLNQDFYEAVKCYAKFSGKYFQNSVDCGFRGDATFTMAMNKGIPLERNCLNGVDDDGNGLADCRDPFCKSVATHCCPCTPTAENPCLECQTHKALECDWLTADMSIGRCDSVQYKPGDLCCSRQNKIVSGLECQYKGADDGYYDCECIPDEFGQLPTDLGTDCQPPGYSFGDLCCTRTGEVIKASADEFDDACQL